MEVFHHFAKQEIEYKTIDVAELEEELEAFKNDKAKDVKACEKDEAKDDEASEKNDSGEDDDIVEST